MTAANQHGFHPDAESLSAFSEQALGERERGKVLSHLAVCGRCRHVVSLAREAADAGAAKASAPSRKAIEPIAWWKQWRLVWVPTAIVAAFIVTSISFYIRQVDQREANFKITAQSPAQGLTPAPTPSPAEQAQVEPPASPAPTPPPAHAAKQTHPAANPPSAEPSPTVAAQMPSEPGAGNQREAPPLHHAYEQLTPPESPDGITGSSYTQPAVAAWDDKQKQAGEQHQAQANPPRVRAYTARPAPAAVGGPNQPAPPAASETVSVTAAAPTVTTTDGLAQPTPSLAISSLWKTAPSMKQIHLPSGLAVVSSISAEPFVLALDKAGTLFLSEDRGDTWRRVKKQWRGHAVEVAQQSEVNAGLPYAPPVHSGPDANNSRNTNNAYPPPAVFELSNDKGQAWVSTDGRTWTAK